MSKSNKTGNTNLKKKPLKIEKYNPGGWTCTPEGKPFLASFGGTRCVTHCKEEWYALLEPNISPCVLIILFFLHPYYIW